MNSVLKDYGLMLRMKQQSRRVNKKVVATYWYTLQTIDNVNEFIDYKIDKEFMFSNSTRLDYKVDKKIWKNLK